MPACPVCNSENVVDKFQLYDDRYGYDRNFQLLGCQDCRHIFLRHDFSSADIEQLYTHYYPRAEIDPDTVKPLQQAKTFSAWLKGEKARACFWVPANVRVLDVGCGSGETLLYHRQRGCDVTGTEADANVAAVARHHELPIHIGQFDPASFPKKTYDYITLDQVVEHLTDPGKMLIELSELMKPDAKLVISTPNAAGMGARLFGRSWVNWHTPYHLHFFSERSMRILATTAGLEIIESRFITSSDWLYFQFMHSLTLPEQGNRSLFWLNQPLTEKHQVFMRKLFHLMKQLRLFDLCTRLFDALNVGDNLVFVLKKKCH